MVLSDKLDVPLGTVMQTTASFAEMTLNRNAANDCTGRKPDGESEPTWTAFRNSFYEVFKSSKTLLI